MKYALNDSDTNTYDVVEEDLQDCPEMFERLLSDVEKLLYDCCNKFTKFSAILKLYDLEANNGWSRKNFTNLLTILKDMLPKDNVLSN